MIEEFAMRWCTVSSEFLDLNHTGENLTPVSLVLPKFAEDTSIEQWRTSEAGH